MAPGPPPPVLRVAPRQPEPAFVGRAREIASLGEALAEGRLATIIGPGGMGKTRLARRFCEARAHAYPGGVWFCELSHGRTAEDICVALARALDLRGAPPTLVERLGDALAARGACAVVLDGLDGLVAPARSIVEAWLASAPRAVFVATSRERLGAAEERVVDLPPLGLPPESDEAVTLFVERARAAGGQLDEGDLGAITRLVRELSGIPLAIELCAARASILTPGELCELLPRRLAVLVGPGPEARQRTMRGAIAWSVDMLSPEERSAFVRCSVFRGGFFRDAAEAAIGAAPGDRAAASPSPEATHVLDVLSSLRQKSLIWSARAGDRTRFGLFEVIREYAEEIAGGEAEAARARHAAHYLAVLEERSPLVTGPKSGDALRALAIDEENILEMIARHLAPSSGGATRDRAAALRALAALEPLILTQGATERHLELLSRAVGEGAADPERASLPPDLLARVLNTRAIVRRIRGQPQKALEDLEGTIAIATAADDRRREGMARGALGFLFTQLGRFDEALAQYELAGAALSAGGAAPEVRADHTIQMGALRLERGEPALAREAFTRARELLGDAGSPRAMGVVIGCLGTAEAQEGRFAEARVGQRRAAAIFEELGDTRNLALATMGIARTLADEGHAEEALSSLERSTALFRTIDYKLGELTAAGHRASVLHETGRLDEALACYRASTSGLFKLGARSREGLFLAGMGALLAGAGRPREAEDAFHEAEDRLSGVANPHLRAALGLHRLHLSPPGERDARLRKALEELGGASDRSPEIRFAVRLLVGALPLSPGGAPARERPDIELDLPAGRVVIDGARSVDLRKKPLLARMLEVLLEREGRSIDKASLFREVWGADYAPATRAASLYKAVDRLAHLLSPEDPKRFLRWDEQGSLYIPSPRARRAE